MLWRQGGRREERLGRYFGQSFGRRQSDWSGETSGHKLTISGGVSGSTGGLYCYFMDLLVPFQHSPYNHHALINILSSFLDYFLDEETKETIKKCHQGKNPVTTAINQPLETKAKVLFIKSIVIFQKSLRPLQWVVGQTQRYYTILIKSPIEALAHQVRMHPITVCSCDTAEHLVAAWRILLSNTTKRWSNWTEGFTQVVKENQLKRSAHKTTHKLRTVIEAAYCYTKDNSLYLKSQELYDMIRDKYMDLKRRFTEGRSETQFLEQQLSSEFSVENFEFQEPLTGQRLSKARSNEGSRRRTFQCKNRESKVHKISEAAREETEVSSQRQRKRSMSECGGHCDPLI